jgi:hypothetical protein
MINTKIVELIIKSIIKSQFSIIGPLAIEQANKVKGLSVSSNGNPTIEGKGEDATDLLTSLVKQYEQLFGQTSVEVCKEAIKEAQITIVEKDLPEILR